MPYTNYPIIGTKVTYIRQNQLGEAERGSGTVLGIGLDANKRITAHLELDNDKKDKVNVDTACLNPSEDFIQDFAIAIKKIEVITKEGNSKVQELVELYNKQVEKCYDNVLGKPVVFDGDKKDTTN